MKVIIPLAGKGTRLRPHTHVTPKPLLRVAGKPVLQYVLDDIERLGTVTEIVYITGHLKEAVERYAREASRIPCRFIEQRVQDGTAGAVALARDVVREPVLIVFVDTIFDADLSVIATSDADGIIWTKEVEDYQRFGVVVTDAAGMMTRIVEKPAEPVSRRANIGLYYIRDWELLFRGIDQVLAAPRNKGEWYLTDAFQWMIEQGARIRVEDVAGWHDAGQVDTLLATNRVMLESGRARRPAPVPPGVTVHDPVYVEDGVQLARCAIGPNVSLLAGTAVTGGSLRDTIVGAGSTLIDCELVGSLVGDAVRLERVRGTVNVGDHSEVVAG